MCVCVCVCLQAFNWTWHYRMDSDVHDPVCHLRQSQSLPSHSQLQKQMQGKTKLIAWFVSHCSTLGKREDYVKQLQKVVPVDIYGECGPFKCPKHNISCYSLLNDYFFYLSFENSLCPEYITEKYYKTFYQGVNVLSVVRGGANYSRFFPEGTFIDADWFKGPEELGRYLLALAKDPARYVDLMWRRAHFEFHTCGDEYGFCRLCYKLHHLHRYRKTYTDLFEWYHEAKCREPNPL